MTKMRVLAKLKPELGIWENISDIPKVGVNDVALTMTVVFLPSATKSLTISEPNCPLPPKTSILFIVSAFTDE